MTAIDQAKAAADIRIIAAGRRTSDIIARDGLTLPAIRGLRRREHVAHYTANDAALDALRSRFAVVADF